MRVRLRERQRMHVSCMICLRMHTRAHSSTPGYTCCTFGERVCLDSRPTKVSHLHPHTTLSRVHTQRHLPTPCTHMEPPPPYAAQCIQQIHVLLVNAFRVASPVCTRARGFGRTGLGRGVAAGTRSPLPTSHTPHPTPHTPHPTPHTLSPLAERARDSAT